MYKSKHFAIEELVPEHIFKKYGPSKCWEFIDPELMKMADIIKERFPDGTMSINTYKWGGNRNFSGLRTSDSKYYSIGSMHSFGRAIDCIFSKYTADEVREDIINNPEIYYAIKGLEKNISWVHFDTRPRNNLLVFTP